jgi:esterase FrsA
MDLTRTETERLAAVSPELAARIPGFVQSGVDEEKLISAIKAAGTPGNPGWPAMMTAIGEREWDAAVNSERTGDPRSAERGFMVAAFWFFLARFPHILNEAGGRAYQRHNEAYARAARYFAHPTARVDIPFEGTQFPGILRLPKHISAPAPLVLIFGGIDVWKSDLEIHQQSDALLERGLATLAIDGPGTGEAPLKAKSDADRLHRQALDWARGDDRVNGARLGVYGLSFGGHFAAKLALTEPALAGVVQVGGPIHLAFGAEKLIDLPMGTRLALSRVCGVPPGPDPTALVNALASLSLNKQGLLPASRNAPLLSINGENDELVPIEDLHWLGENGVRQDTLVFTGDRHCASRNRDSHEAFASDWLARKLQPIKVCERGGRV